MEILKTREGTDPLKEETNQAEDMNLAMFLLSHIENPCEVKLADGQVENVRHVYINIAKKILENLKNPFARKILEDVMKKYAK